MKRYITISVLLSFTALSAFGWGRQGHATVARIAEDHLTKTTKQCIDEILGGEHITQYASYGDDMKSALLYDYGYDFTDGNPRRGAYPHTFEVDAKTFRPTQDVYDNGRYVKNCIYFIKKYSEELKDWRHLSDSTRFVELVYMVHWFGDMHCPMHIRYYPVDMNIGHLNVIFAGEPLDFHHFWDSEALITKYPWSFSDLAYLFDTYSPEQIAAVIAGTPDDWGEDSARASWPMHQVKEGTKITGRWFTKNLPLVKSQIANAGYRLAHQLNMIFDAKYAKKYDRSLGK